MNASPDATRIPPRQVDWSIAVFARNEAAVLGPCLASLAAAAAGRNALVTLILNGTTDDSAASLALLAREAGIALDVQQIAFGDKSNAWNQFIHAARPQAQTYFFVDAYAMPAPGALAALEQRLAEAPQANAAAAVPSCGRAAEATRAAMLERPALHGSLFALRGTFVERIAAAGLRLPVGLYRGDGLIGSFVVHNLDALGHPWTLELIAVAPAATWAVKPLSMLRVRDIRRRVVRLLRQGRGSLEDAAIKACVYRTGFAGLPRYADRMILDWIAADPAARTPSLRRDPFGWLAARALQPPREPDEAALAAHRLLFTPAA
jgi:hypothetical protein